MARGSTSGIADVPLSRTSDEEIKAVQTMHHALQVTPHSYSLLHVQCDFLRSKGKADWALKLANESVNCAPTEFTTWAKLTECHIETSHWEEVSMNQEFH